jgi:predicted short-subunit dehydrogenase-like oxidoreductase (DUF2520 family)
MFRISIIGAGNVAWHLAQALENAGHTIKEVWSRSPENAARLVDHLYAAEVHDSLDFSLSEAEVFILSVSDAAASAVLEQLMLPPNALLVHTSGALPLEILAPAANAYGVFYPLQTFSKGRAVNFQQVPFCLEAGDKESLKQLRKLAGSLSKQIYELNGAKRQVLHVAAVFACNFTNHLLRISEEILDEHEIEGALLHPLIAETIQKSMEIGAAGAQTGPAVREDRSVLAAHLQQLEAQPAWAELYYLLSEDIIRLHT